VGHQAVLSLVRERTAALQGESVILTFERHPREVLSGVKPNPITSLHHRLALIADKEVDACIVLRFNRTLSEMEPDAFLSLLLRTVGLAEMVVGPDSAFGRNGRGDLAFLKARSGPMGFGVRSAEAVSFRGEAVSSTRIRKCILAGDMDSVTAMLGRRFSLFGTVVQGDGRGRSLGYPTANLDIHGEVVPPLGVYATRTNYRDLSMPSVTSIGRRPTFGGKLPVTIETFILDYGSDLYGADVELVFEAWLRDEITFDGPQALARAIAKDVSRAREILE
jgi:riboflavin kinase/FMN adenylyltransferase